MTPPPPSPGSIDDQLTARLLHQRVLVLGQELDDRVAQRLCSALLLLAAEDPHRDITVYVNSPGGPVTAGLAVHDTVRLVPNDVSTVALGLAAGTAQVLLAAGTPGKRFALPHARVQVSPGPVGSGAGAGGRAADLEDVEDLLVGLVAEHTGQPRDQVEEDARRGRWFTAEQARDHGLVDEVLHDLAPVATSGPGRTVGLGVRP